MREKIVALRMERQHLTQKASKEEYDALYRDMQPGQSVYWNGFGMPPCLSFRTDFDDTEYNRIRQSQRRLIKGRFADGNLGWIVSEDLELFMAVYRKPIRQTTKAQRIVFEMIEQQGPSNIQRIKEETGLLVKEITPALHRLQEAFLLYEDQYDGEWDRGWYRMEEMFPNANAERYTRREALRELFGRFAYRQVWFDAEMLKAYFKVPARDILAAVSDLEQDGMLISWEGGWMRAEDEAFLREYQAVGKRFVYAVHRNDFLYRAMEPTLKARFAPLCQNLPYDHEALQYLLIDGEFHGVVVGHFRNGPYDLNDVVLDLPADEASERREEILCAVRSVNFGKSPERFFGERQGEPG